METKTVNTELWAFEKGNIVYDDDRQTIINPTHHKHAELIVAAVNACKAINQDNPLAVAKSIVYVFEALKELCDVNNWPKMDKRALYNAQDILDSSKQTTQ